MILKVMKTNSNKILKSEKDFWKINLKANKEKSIAIYQPNKQLPEELKILYQNWIFKRKWKILNWLPWII